MNADERRSGLVGPRNHLVGYVAILGGEAREGRVRFALDQARSAGNEYGKTLRLFCAGGFGFGLCTPEKGLSLSTWSLYCDETHTCFVEGALYDNYSSHRVRSGEDPALARTLLDGFRDGGKRCLEALNGSFSGFIFEHGGERLHTFVDRLATRALYWARERGNTIVSTSLASLCAFERFAMDEIAAFQCLTVGFPIGERTLLRGVGLQAPSSIYTHTRAATACRRYWDPPARMTRLPLKDGVDSIAEAVEQHVSRIHDRTPGPIGLGLTGGHDSRVILSALSYTATPFDIFSWMEGTFNDAVVHRLALLLGKSVHVVKDARQAEIDDIKRAVFVHTDGMFFHLTGFSRLARDCFERGIGAVMLGYTGDKISGSLTIPAPHYHNSVVGLAGSALRNQMELLSFEEARKLFRGGEASIAAVTVSEWFDSFVRESARDTLTDIAMWQGLANRNLKRVRYSVIPALQFVQPVFPYLDSRVMDAYLSLPLGLINNQKVHCLAGFHRFPEFGKYRACGYPVPLRWEACWPTALHLVRRCSHSLSSAAGNMRLFGRRDPSDGNSRQILDSAADCPLFEPGALQGLSRRKALKYEVIHRIDELVRFYHSYASARTWPAEDLSRKDGVLRQPQGFSRM